MNPAALHAALPLLAQGWGDLLSPDGLLKIGSLVSVGAAVSATWWLAGKTYRGKLRQLKKNLDHYQDLHAAAAGDRDRQTTLAHTLQQKYAETTTKLIELTGRHEAVVRAGLIWKQRAKQFEAEFYKHKREVARLQAEVAQLAGDKSGLGTQVEQLSVDVADRQAAINRTEKRMRRALRLEGQLWAAKALQGRPAFRELAKRNRAVIAVLNLKGGVGKTTVTAHLGAALARRGYRVLAVDLDLQGSLTSMLLPQGRITQLFRAGELLQHFLNRAAEYRTTKITGYAQPVFDVPETGGSLSVVGTTDNLAYAELNLTMRWLLHSGTRDTRFLLRKALHLMSVGNQFDIVLLDCPPLINVSCVNALAASDYLLIPTSMSQKSLERVPMLVRRVLRSEKFLKHINHDLRLLGLVANRTWRDKLSDGETDDWNRLADKCKDVYGQDVKRFNTIITQQLKEIRDSEAEFGIPDPTSRLGEAFARLAGEVEQELPSECRRLAKAPR
jgi:cellulose biosynthesis protein BcsQ